MSARITMATARRVLTQLRRDHRTMALLLAVPVLLLTLLLDMYDGQPQAFDAVGGPLLALCPFTTMFLVTSVAMLRERTSGTLERLLTTPLGRADLLLGYALAFGAVAIVQTVIAATVALGLLGLTLAAFPALVVLLAVLDALLGMALGLFLSAFARSEFQAVQFLPAFVLPQLLLCGLFVERSAMAAPLRWLSDVFPLTYAVDGMQRLAASPAVTGTLTRDLLVVAGASFLALGLGPRRCAARAHDRRPAARGERHPRRDPRGRPAGLRDAGLRRHVGPGRRPGCRGRPLAGAALLRLKGRAVRGRPRAAPRPRRDRGRSPGRRPRHPRRAGSPHLSRGLGRHARTGTDACDASQRRLPRGLGRDAARAAAPGDPAAGRPRRRRRPPTCAPRCSPRRSSGWPSPVTSSNSNRSPRPPPTTSPRCSDRPCSATSLARCNGRAGT